MTESVRTQGAEAFLSGQSTSVDVSSIEKELHKLWAEAAGTQDEPSGRQSVVRTCTFNLVLITSDEEAETAGNDMLDEVVTHHPARAILAIYRPNRPHRLEAWVSARCHFDGKHKQVCSEQITVCCDGGQPQELTSIVIPLIRPEIPVFLWWRHTNINATLLEPLKNCAKRLIVDSHRHPFDLKRLADIAQLSAEHGSHLWLSDTNWRRLLGWCRTLANAFDGFPLPLESLHKMNSVKISYCKGESTEPSAQSLLFAGWLAGRLSWEPKSIARGSLELTATVGERSGSPVKIEFLPVGHPFASPGTVVEIDCQFADNSDLRLFLDKQTDGIHIVAASTRPQARCEAECVPFDASEAYLIGQEVEVLGPDRIYQAAIAMVGRFLALR